MENYFFLVFAHLYTMHSSHVDSWT